MECSKCGVSGSKTRLLDVISREGIVKLCEKCFLEENMPLVRKPANFQLKDSVIIPKSSVKKTVYERLSEISGVQNRKIPEKELLNKQETTLKDIVNKNFEIISGEGGSAEDLIDNFHWVIMRARRLKHLTQGQFAKAIAEPEAAIKAIEKGFLPKNNYRLIKKIENYLQIKLLKKETEQKQEFEKEISFDPVTAKTLTIADLQDMKKKKEEEIFKKPIEEEKNYVLNEEVGFEDKPEFVKGDNKELSDEEMDKIIFGKR